VLKCQETTDRQEGGCRGLQARTRADPGLGR
jgi:hypothetical protein